MRGSTRSFQYRVTTSTLLLPVVIVLGIAGWIAGATDWLTTVGGLICYGATTYLVMELNNSNALIRLRSRMASATLASLWAMCQFLHPFQKAHIVVLLIAVTYHFLFASYYKSRTVGLVFPTFLALAVSGLFHACLLWLIIPFIMAFAHFQALSVRSFCAAFIGLLLPVWVGSSWAFLTDCWPEVWTWVVEHFRWPGLDFSEWTPLRTVSFLFVWFLSLISTIHLLWTCFQDKIRTRDLLYFLSWMVWVYTVLMLVYPQAFSILFLLQILNSSPLIGHFLVLTHTRLSNIFFVVVIGLWAVLAILNLWMPSYNF